MEFLVIRPYPGAALGAGAVRTLAAYALRRRGRERWAAVRVEAFCAGGRTLLLARPACAYSVSVAEYARPFLRKYFKC